MVAAAKSVVVDASVVLAWILPDESISPAANKLYQNFAEGKFSLVAPHLLYYEVLNGIKSAVVQHRLDKNLFVESVHQFNHLDVRLESQPEGEDIVILALNLGLSVYDATYIALSQKLNATFYTTDQKLAKITASAVKTKLLG